MKKDSKKDGLRRLVMFARAPVAGKVKTRLVPSLGSEGALALHRRLVLRTLRSARAFCEAHDAELEVRIAEGDGDALKHWLGDDWRFREQKGGDLGERMSAAFDESFHESSTATVLIGSDCPSLTPDVLASAFECLKTHGAVLGPARDGGYYLIGLTAPMPGLFRDIAWGTESVLAQSLAVLSRESCQSALLETLDDLDRPEDLSAWRRIVAAEDEDGDRVSVIIPALNEEGEIAATIQSVLADAPHQVIVADGGSVDATCAVAQAAGATVIHSSPGRARQMNAGAAQASGNVLLFLHADTTLPVRWRTAVGETLGRPNVAAGAFRFSIREHFIGRRWVEWMTNWRSCWLQCPYGDQALFLRRALFEELGGFAALPIMEDYELIRRLRRQGRIAISTEATAMTSGRRWKQHGVLKTTMVNQLMIAGHHLGVNPATLANFYRRR